MKKSPELTKAEEQIMLILWKKESAFVRDILEELGKNKPAYNTVSTIVRILETKGFVKHKAIGKSHAYFPVVSKEQYLNNSLSGLIGNYFNAVPENLVTYLISQKMIPANTLRTSNDNMEPETKSEKGKKKKNGKKPGKKSKDIGGKIGKEKKGKKKNKKKGNKKNKKNGKSRVS